MTSQEIGKVFADFNRLSVEYGYELQRRALACPNCEGHGCTWPGAWVCKVCEELRAEIRERGIGFRVMDIYAEPGTKVVFANALNGWPDDVRAARELQLGTVFTVSKLNVYDSSSEVELVEIPGKRFNTVQFVEAP